MVPKGGLWLDLVLGLGPQLRMIPKTPVFLSTSCFGLLGDLVMVFMGPGP